MNFYITDSDLLYQSSKSKFRFLFKGWVIEKWSLQESAEDFNLDLNGIEYEAADAMHLDLKVAVDQLKNTQLRHNKFLATRKTSKDICFSLLYNSYWQLCINKHVLRLVIERLINRLPEKISKVSIHLKNEYSLIETDFDKYFPDLIPEFKFYKKNKFHFWNIPSSLKKITYNLYYFYQNLVFSNRQEWSESKTKILLLIYDAPSLHIVLEKFYQLVTEQKNLHLTIVTMSIGIDPQKAIDAHKLQAENISVLDYTKFRKGNFISHQDLYKAIKKWHPNYAIIEEFAYLENLENHYAWMGNVFQKLQPNVCLTIGLTESTRVISDVSRYFSIPSVNLDYGLFTDDALFMQSNIEFDVRACVGQANIDIWKKRSDPSHVHQLIGFCKLDSYQDDDTFKSSFFEKHGLLKDSKTILFGGSWAAANKSYNLEKKKIITELAELCHRKKWNLLVKLHPAEADGIIKNCIAEFKFAHQIVFEHQDETLNKLILCSDIVTTQSSSMVIDTLFFKKPFCYLSSKQKNNVTDLYSSFKEDKLIETFNHISDFEKFAESFSDENNLKIWLNKLEEKRSKYLYNPNGKASERLLNLLIQYSNLKKNAID